MRYSVAIILFFFGLSVHGQTPRPEGRYGLSFHAYEKNKDERTVLTIPGDGRTLRFRDYLSVGFDLKIRGETEHFGYVCRIVLGGETSVDLLLSNPFDGIPELCLIGDNRLLGNIDALREKLDSWNRLLLEIRAEGDVFAVTVNGLGMGESLPLPSGREVNICFGAVDLTGFSTTDVAPFVLRNLTVGFSPGEVSYSWPLDVPDRRGVVESLEGGMSASVIRPYWQVFDHMRWKRIGKAAFGSKTFIVPERDERAVLFVSKDVVRRFDLLTRKQTDFPFSPGLPVENMANQFVCDPVKGDLLLYDFEGALPEGISRFDFSAGRWSVPLRKAMESGCQHHNSFFSPVDTSLIQLFGYGYHRYLSVMNRITSRGEVRTDSLSGIIPPRYLSAVGIADTMVYIYGGMGNEKGFQEYGTQVFRDLYAMDLRDYSVRKCWDLPSKTSSEVAASRLIVGPEGKEAYALFFDPGRFVSRLQLKRIGLADGETVSLGDTIPFVFHDVHSDATLLCDTVGQRLFAVTMHRIADRSYEANLYSIDLPLLEALPQEEAGRTWIWVLIGCAAAAGGAACWAVRRRIFGRREETVRAPGPVPYVQGQSLQEPAVQSCPLPTGIHLLGGFRVTDRQGEDISGEFTPMMKRLLSLIVLYTADGKGISNARLRESLWPDKSEESSQNNRSVNIRKIRLLLEGVGNFEIASDNGCWKILLHGDSYCDYLYAMHCLAGSREDGPLSAPLLELAARGQLLPDQSYDWLDGFKAAYSDAMIALLSRWRERIVAADDYRMQILLSERILQFDSLDEESVRVKCHALVALRRIGAAKSAFDNFVREYLQVMGEHFPTEFDSFVR